MLHRTGEARDECRLLGLGLVGNQLRRLAGCGGDHGCGTVVGGAGCGAVVDVDRRLRRLQSRRGRMAGCEQGHEALIDALLALALRIEVGHPVRNDARVLQVLVQQPSVVGLCLLDGAKLGAHVLPERGI